MAVTGNNYHAYLGKKQGMVDKALDKIKQEDIIARIWKHDYTIWKPEPTEISNRLGWLNSPDYMKERISEISRFVEEVKKAGYKQALLMGMGGSSLAPEVFRKTFGVKSGYLDLSVLDSTDPAAIMQHENQLDLEKTLFIVSTKSGSTVETLSFMKYFYNKLQKTLPGEEVGQHFIAITDPGSSLEKLAKDLKYREIFLNDSEVGGRYSALTHFGLVPAALVGVDLTRLLENAEVMSQNCKGYDYHQNSAAHLGATLGEMAKNGQDKVTFIASPEIKHFGTWVEQLIAESSGKEGRGILPVDGEEVLSAQDYSPDRLFVYLHYQNTGKNQEKVAELKDAGLPLIQINFDNLYDLGREYFRWEFAIAIAGWCLDINPFNQPNVESAKVQARKMVDAYKKSGELPELSASLTEGDLKVYTDEKASDLKGVLNQFFNKASQGDSSGKNRSYITLQAYLTPDEQNDKLFHEFRTFLQKKYKMATTFGYGPRFLHSTGQLHKGDAGHGMFLQFLADIPKDAKIPDQPGDDASSISFGILKTAQCLGDRQALKNVNRHVILINLGSHVKENLQKLMKTLQ
jgi:glucose-6-phosphate isomerase